MASVPVGLPALWGIVSRFAGGKMDSLMGSSNLSESDRNALLLVRSSLVLLMAGLGELLRKLDVTLARLGIRSGFEQPQGKKASAKTRKRHARRRKRSGEGVSNTGRRTVAGGVHSSSYSEDSFSAEMEV